MVVKSRDEKSGLKFGVEKSKVGMSCNQWRVQDQRQFYKHLFQTLISDICTNCDLIWHYQCLTKNILSHWVAKSLKVFLRSSHLKKTIDKIVCQLHIYALSFYRSIIFLVGPICFEQIQFVLVGSKSFLTGPNYKN